MRHIQWMPIVLLLASDPRSNIRLNLIHSSMSAKSLTNRARARALKIQQSLNSPYDEILPYMYIGSDPSRLANLDTDLDTYLTAQKFTHRIDCTAHPTKETALPTFFITVTDDDKSTASLFQQLEQACDFIDAGKQQTDFKILIHCVAGVSRSATVILYYLLTRRNQELSLAQLLQYMREKRPIVSPNPSFMRALCCVETKMGKPLSIDPDAYAVHRHGRAKNYIVFKI